MRSVIIVTIDRPEYINLVSKLPCETVKTDKHYSFSVIEHLRLSHLPRNISTRFVLRHLKAARRPFLGQPKK